jgi:hypothetical protein
MRDRGVRLAFLGLILAIPLLLESMAPATIPGANRLASGRLIYWVEAVLVTGIVVASRHRQTFETARTTRSALATPSRRPLAPRQVATRPRTA